MRDVYMLIYPQSACKGISSISLGVDKENLLNNHELVWFVIISFIPVTSILDSWVKGEIRC